MTVATKGDVLLLSTNIADKLKAACGALNAEIEQDSDEPAHRRFRLLGAAKLPDGIFEARFTWEQLYRYWAPDVTLKSIYTLGIGFALVDTVSSKALVCCHSLPERQLLTQLVGKATGMSFVSLVLTKPLLALIGEFEKVRRAAYFARKKTSNQAANVAYADEKLSTIPSIRAQEESPDFERKQSFYKIDLVGLTETGIGATSDSGKLWIPAEVPIDTVRDYGVALLKKISGTLRRMSKESELSAWFNVLSIEHIPSLAAVRPMELRHDIQRLIRELVQMVLKRESERAFSLPLSFATFGVPQFFEYPRLRLRDEESGEVSYWSNPSHTSQLLQARIRGGRPELESVPEGNALNLKILTHPITNSEIAISDPLSELEVRPTPRLHSILLDAFSFMVGEKPELKRVNALPLVIGSGVLRLDVTLALNPQAVTAFRTELSTAEVEEFQTVLAQSVSGSRRKDLQARLHELGEKCAHMSDTNCGACLGERRYLCLRSLLARFLRHHLLLSHKGIELSDLQGQVTVAGDLAKMFVFSKLARTNATLTLRNDAGAVLFSQIAAQIDRTTFKIVGVLTPSTINEDLRERLTFLAGLVGKRVLFIDSELLTKMLSYFEEQTEFDGQDPARVYQASKSEKDLKGPVPKGSGRFVASR